MKRALTLAALSFSGLMADPIADQSCPVETPPPPLSPCGCPEESVHNFEFGGNYTYVKFRSFHGNLGGAQGLYEYRPKNGFYGAAQLFWTQGNTEGSGSERFLRFIDAQERVGYTFARNDWKVSLFTGLGYHFLAHKLTPGSLHINYTEFYVPVGVKADGNFNSWSSVSTTWIWMPQIFPTATISPLGGSHWSLTNKYGNFYVDLSFNFKIASKWTFNIVPYYLHWADGHSTAKAGGLSLGLPGNTYNFWGVNLDFSYRF